ncbi:MAG TPA: DUF4349 domain-containing protein [Ilumatobacter sp.]|nr:DUF4349 domain-containing protein [Ilumatobacter sp.]
MGRTHDHYDDHDRHDRHIRGHPRRRHLGRPLAAVMVAATVLAACAGEDDDSSGDASFATAAAEAAGRGDGAIELSGAAATDAPNDADAGEPPRGVPTQGGIDHAQVVGTVGRNVIIELRVQMETDDIARTVAAITADAVNVGGGVASSDVSYGTTRADGEPNRDGHAVLVLKVPPAEVGKVVANLSGTGRVLSMNQSAEDVTDQLIDLDVRITNKRSSVENVRKMMDQTTDLSQLVTLEAELTWRRTELEQLEAQQRNLGDRVALSTITVEVRPTPAAVADTGPVDDDDDTIGDAFRRGWDAFRDVTFGIAYVLAALTPFLVVAFVAGGVAWTANRLRRRPPNTEPAEQPDDELTPV